MNWIRENLNLRIQSSDWEVLEPNQQAALLQRALLFTTFVSFLIILFTYRLFREYPIRYLLSGWTLTVTLVCLVLLRKNRISWATHLTTYGFWLSLTMLVAFSGGLYSPWVIAQLTLVVVSGILFSGQAALGIAVFTVVADSVIVLLQRGGILPFPRGLPEFSDVFAAFVSSFILMGTTLYLARNMVLNGLYRARQNELRYQSLFDKTNDAVFMVNAQEVLIGVNKRAADMLGYTEKELIGVPYERLVIPEEQEESGTNFLGLHESDRLPLFERTLVRKDGSRCTVEFSASAVKNERGDVLYFQGVARNVNERKLLEQQLKDSLAEMENVAMHDPLTGMLNRRAITERAEMEWHRAQRENRPLSMMLLDIDNFKEINDEYGHLVGDEVLKVLAKALRGAIRGGVRRGYDWAGRWGGDEFLVVLPGANLPASEDVAERLRTLVVNNPVELETGKLVELRVSVGVACYSGRKGEEIPLERLLIQADQALYKAKESGRNQVSVFRDQVA